MQEPDADPEDRDEYTAENIFWVPPDARWSQIAAKAKSPQIGEIVDKHPEEAVAIIRSWMYQST